MFWRHSDKRLTHAISRHIFFLRTSGTSLALKQQKTGKEGVFFHKPNDHEKKNLYFSMIFPTYM